MFFEELVKEHHVHRIVAHGVYPAITAASHQIGAYLFYVLSNESKTEWTRRLNLRFVAEAYWLECVDHFAGLLYRFVFSFETPRCRWEPELFIGINLNSFRSTCLFPNIAI